MDELKPCPFCGGEAKQWYCTPQGHLTANFFGALCRGVEADHNIIICGKCGCRTKVYTHKSRAFAAWNRRAEDADK